MKSKDYYEMAKLRIESGIDSETKFDRNGNLYLKFKDGSTFKPGEKNKKGSLAEKAKENVLEYENKVALALSSANNRPSGEQSSDGSSRMNSNETMDFGPQEIISQWERDGIQYCRTSGGLECELKPDGSYRIYGPHDELIRYGSNLEADYDENTGWRVPR